MIYNLGYDLYPSVRNELVALLTLVAHHGSGLKRPLIQVVWVFPLKMKGKTQGLSGLGPRMVVHAASYSGYSGYSGFSWYSAHPI